MAAARLALPVLASAALRLRHGKFECCSTSVAQSRRSNHRRETSLEMHSTSSRRQFLLVGSLPLTHLLGGHGASAAALPATPTDGSQEEPGRNSKDSGDVFGFDGLGKSPDDYVRGKVVAVAQAGDGAVLFLGVDGFELPLQLVVGPAEAMAVLTAVQERKTRRPTTHEAWGLSLAAVGWQVDRVAITGNEKDIFYSRVVLSNLSQLLLNPSGVKKSIDMRPSDGIALALRCRAPLFIYRKVAEDLLAPKDFLEKVQVDPLKQPGLQASLPFLDRSVQNLMLIDA